MFTAAARMKAQTRIFRRRDHVRDVNVEAYVDAWKAFVDALAEQITPRAGAPQSDTFAAAITGGLRDPTPEGSTTTIRLDPDGTISVLDDTGLVTAHVVVPAVCDAFLDIYLGADGISPTTLEAVKAGLEKF